MAELYSAYHQDGGWPDDWGEEAREMVRQNWYPASTKDIEKALSFPIQKQCRYLRVLVKSGRIKVKRAGLPAKRWVYLLPQRRRTA
jgi:hypothetical protein